MEANAFSLTSQGQDTASGPTPDQERPYQTVAEDKVVAFLLAGKKTLLVAPTGAGKTRMARNIIRKYLVALAALSPLPATSRGAMILAHTVVLREQNTANIPGVPVVTIQSLIAPGHMGNRRRELLQHYHCFFVDEAHHLVGEDWRELVPHLHSGLFGATATPERADGTPLGDVFEEIVVAASYSELVRDGYLCPCDVAEPEVSRKNQKKLKIRPDGVAAFLSHCYRPDGSVRPGIFFDSTIALCELAVEQLTAKGIRAKVVSCNTGPDERQETFDAYSRGELDLLASPMALSEGFDSPRAEICVLRRTAQGLGTYLQIAGRVLRPYPGKECALLIDICDAKSVHGFPTDDRAYSLLGKGISNVMPEAELEPEEQDPVMRYQTIEAKFDIVRDRLRDLFRELKLRGDEAGYKRGWIGYRMEEKTGVKMPLPFEAKFKSVCKHCRRRLKVGEQMFWLGTGKVYHEDCYFASLDQDTLKAVDAKAPEQQRVFMKQEPLPAVSMEGVPF